MKLRIHHFYDIIRDYGKNQQITSHEYGHLYHKIADFIRHNHNEAIEIVLSHDDVCVGCKYFKDNHCLDTIDHRSDFQSKEDFNNHIDTRIMQVCEIKTGDTMTPIDLIEKLKSNLDKIEWIYEGNDKEHNALRKKYLIEGIRRYKSYIA